MNNILYINNYINELEKRFLEGEDKKYIEVCKNIYGVNIGKISINIWTSHIMGEFRQNIIKNCENINNIEEISINILNILKILKEDRKNYFICILKRSYIRIL